MNGREEPGDEKVPAYSWYVLGILVVVYILNFVDRQILSILANDIKADLGLTDEDLGFLYGTAFAVFYALFGIPLGRLADSWQRVRLLSLGLTLWSVMTALSGFARNGAQLTLARIGVGVGEATASPSAYSLISDLFPQRLRATALAIYSSGLYLGGGLSLLIGGLIVENWNSAWPKGGPLGLVGWQAAFLAVGVPGLILALWVLSIREPLRGAIDGLPTPPSERPFAGFWEALLDVVPPLTLIGAARRGAGPLVVNLAFAALVWTVAHGLSLTLGQPLTPVTIESLGLEGSLPNKQWIFVGIGAYAVFSWASALKPRDPPTFKLIWGSPAFLCTMFGYGMVSFTSYAASYWGAPYAERVFGIDKSDLGLLVGAPAAVAGFLGVIVGGRAADSLQARFANGRVWIVLFGLISPALPVWIAYTTTSWPVFVVTSFLGTMLSASALGAAAATTQALVLPRMRGTATATFFIATTLVGLALGPFMAGYVSVTNDNNLGLGVLSTLVAVPIGAALLFVALSVVPRSLETLHQRAKAAGERLD